MKIIASVTRGDAIQRLDPTQPPRLAPAARGPPWDEHLNQQGTDLSEPPRVRSPGELIHAFPSWFPPVAAPRTSTRTGALASSPRTPPPKPILEPPPTIGAAWTERFPPAPEPVSDRQITAQPVRLSILHCKPALNLLSFFDGAAVQKPGAPISDCC
jgi:hypothetical protein